MKTQDRLAKSIFWLAWSKTLVQGLSLLSTVAVARILDPADYGIMALATMIVAVSTLMSELGVGAAIIQFQDLERRELNGFFWLTISFSVAMYVVLYTAAPMVASWFTSVELTPVLRVVALVLPLSSLRVVPENLLRKQLRFDHIAKAHIAAASLSVPAVLALALAGIGVWALVASTLLMAFVQSLSMLISARWAPTLDVGSARVRPLLRFCKDTLGGRLCWAVYQQTDVFFLGRHVAATSVGVYSMAIQLISLPLDKVFSLVNEISHPAMAHVQRDLDALRGALLRSFRLVAIVSFPIYVGLALTAEDLIPLALTEKWAGAVPIVHILTSYGIMSSFAMLLTPLLLARYRPDLVFRYAAAQMLIMPLAFWIGSAWGGLTGVALAWALAYPIALTWLVQQVLRELQVSWATAGRLLLPAGAAVAGMACMGLVARESMRHWFPEYEYARLALCVTIGAMSYSAAIWLLEEEFLRYIARLVFPVTRTSGEAARVASAGSTHN